jgi:plasmid stabilization system protein ParE
LAAATIEELRGIYDQAQNVYYLAEEKEVRVIRVLHGQRDIQGILEQERV